TNEQLLTAVIFPRAAEVDFQDIVPGVVLKQIVHVLAKERKFRVAITEVLVHLLRSRWVSARFGTQMEKIAVQYGNGSVHMDPVVAKGPAWLQGIVRRGVGRRRSGGVARVSSHNERSRRRDVIEVDQRERRPG